MMTLRHVGILVENLLVAVKTYRRLGFKESAPREILMVQKMTDPEGNTIELVQGNWHPHIAVNWYEDGQGNRIECVRDIRYPEEIRQCNIQRKLHKKEVGHGDHS